MSTPERVRSIGQTWPIHATMISLNVMPADVSAQSVVNHAAKRIQEFGPRQLICLYADLPPSNWRELHRAIREICAQTSDITIDHSSADNRGPRASYVFVASPIS